MHGGPLSVCCEIIYEITANSIGVDAKEASGVNTLTLASGSGSTFSDSPELCTRHCEKEFLATEMQPSLGYQMLDLKRGLLQDFLIFESIRDRHYFWRNPL